MFFYLLFLELERDIGQANQKPNCCKSFSVFAKYVDNLYANIIKCPRPSLRNNKKKILENLL